MSATKEQCRLIDELMTLGASIPENDHGNPDDSMYDSIQQADVYIKKWIYLMARYTTKARADEWGGVLNC